MQTLTRYTPYALTALRVVAALIFIEHGTQKLIGFPAPPEGGLPEAGSLLWVGAWIELIGGALLLSGLFTRAAAFITSGTMAVAYWMFHAPATAPRRWKYRAGRASRSLRRSAPPSPRRRSERSAHRRRFGVAWGRDGALLRS